MKTITDSVETADHAANSFKPHTEQTAGARAYYREWYYGIWLTGSVIAAWMVGVIVVHAFGWLGFGSGVAYYAKLVSSLTVLIVGIVKMLTGFETFLKKNTFDVKSDEFAISFSTVTGSIVYKILAVAGKNGIEWRDILHEGRYHFWRYILLKEEQRHFKKSEIIVSVTRSNAEGAAKPEWHCEVQNYVIGYNEVKDADGNLLDEPGDPILCDVRAALSFQIKSSKVTLDLINRMRTKMNRYWLALFYSRDSYGNRIVGDEFTNAPRREVNEVIRSMIMDLLEKEVYKGETNANAANGSKPLRKSRYKNIEEAKADVGLRDDITDQLKGDILSRQLGLPKGDLSKEEDFIEVNLMLTFNYLEKVIAENVLQEEKEAANNTAMLAKDLEFRQNEIDNKKKVDTSVAYKTEKTNEAEGDRAKNKAAYAYLEGMSKEQLQVLMADKILPKNLQTLIVNSGSGGNGNGADPGMVATILGVAQGILDQKVKPKPAPASDAA